ncbi:hypothetical protein [Paraferrimonas haliotis]|uniref:DUF5666 domain-containing protein n=1 Tax=Paraferrimonas haliotis TaxID=2013866 RepID=A0AA37TQJ8_9GAMM|nr:hypothetical protein [Paraferrimonas haliotis]GLS82801.1 hypothetical protein GCM10007894_07780 [Paraferrimonas haliotis]
MKKFAAILLTLFPLLSASAVADVLALSDGQTIHGKLISQNADTVEFEVAGQTLSFDSAQVASISFENKVAVADSQASPATTESNLLPSGTPITVTMTSGVNTRQHSAGHRFTAVLEHDLSADGQTIAKRGDKVFGVVADAGQSRRVAGTSNLTIEFTELLINNQMHSISSTAISAVTDNTAKDTVGRSARFAAVGGLANGSKGAKDAAKVGLGVSVLTSGNGINIPEGTLLEFQLAAPLAL